MIWTNTSKEGLSPRPGRLERGRHEIPRSRVRLRLCQRGKAIRTPGLCLQDDRKDFLASALIDEDDELPEDLVDNDDYLEIPHKNHLDLGQRLIWRFIEGVAPEEYEEVRRIFSRRGAYRRWRAFLERQGLLDKWYAFEGAETRKAVLEWCDDHGIEIEDRPLS